MSDITHIVIASIILSMFGILALLPLLIRFYNFLARGMEDDKNGFD